MKNKIVSIFILLLVLFTAPFAFAQEVKNGETVILASDTTVDRDYFATGEKVVISGTVNGDAYVFGGNVIVDGTINGDLITGGGNVSISGLVTDDVRAGGGQVEISGEVGKNVTAGGGSVNVSQDAKIGGSLTAGGGNINVFAPLGRGATIGGGNLTLGNLVNGDVTAGAASLTLLQNATIEGNLEYWSSEPVDIQNGAQIKGSTNFHQANPEDKKDIERNEGLGFGFGIYSFIVALIFGFLISRFLPNFAGDVAERITKRPLFHLGIGFLAVIVIPIAAVLVAITVIGIPFALLVVLFYIIDLYLAKIFTAFAVGIFVQKYFKKKWGLFRAVLIGLAAYYILSMIPVIGWITGALYCLIGFGALLLAKKDSFNLIRNRKLL